MRHLSVLIAAVSAIALTQMASAADLPRKAPGPPPPPPVLSWTGFYIGANIGGGWGNRDVNFAPNDPASALVFSAVPVPNRSFDTSGILGGIQVGYNYQFNRNWLAGLEADFAWTGMEGSGSISLAAGLEQTTFDEHIRWFGTVRGRLGYLPVDNLLAYVTGGFAYAQIKRTGNYAATNGGTIIVNLNGFSVNCASPPTQTCFAGASSDVVGGWTLGGGLEYAFWRNWTLKAEYLYVSLDSRSLTEVAVAPSAGVPPASFNANFDRTNFNVARIGVNYRF